MRNEPFCTVTARDTWKNWFNIWYCQNWYPVTYVDFDSSMNKSTLYYDRGIWVLRFKVYEVGIDLNDFTPDGLHKCGMNRSVPWRIGMYEKNNLRLSKSIYRDLYRFWYLNTPLKGIVTPKANTSCSREMRSPKGRDTILHFTISLLFLIQFLHFEVQMYTCFVCKNTLFKQSTWSDRTLYQSVFNVIIILSS